MSAKRYPGVQPFKDTQNELFFGRKSDIERIIRNINLRKLLIIHGKSGMGKTSLIDAGIVPKLQNNNALEYKIK